MHNTLVTEDDLDFIDTALKKYGGNEFIYSVSDRVFYLEFGGDGVNQIICITFLNIKRYAGFISPFLRHLLSKQYSCILMFASALKVPANIETMLPRLPILMSNVFYRKWQIFME